MFSVLNVLILFWKVAQMFFLKTWKQQNVNNEITNWRQNNQYVIKEGRMI